MSPAKIVTVSRSGAALLLGATALSACGASQNAPADLDVTRVVLYQSGVAYLERAGRVTGDELVMPIRADQINDILTTLVVVDHNASGSTSVSLPIDDAAADRLADLPPELRDAGGLVTILHAFRGAEVAVRLDARNVRGRVVGVETIDGEPHVTLLTTGDAMVPIAIADIADVDLRSDSLATGLRRSLDHSLADGEWKPTDVTIRFSQGGTHDVTMAYVVEQPIWKPAYRAVVDGDDLLLQGWAVIDNTSGVDWTDVRLSLTAGSPISFRYDLHTPIFIERPDMSGYGVPDVANLRPPEPVASATRSRDSTRRTARGYGGAGSAAPSAAPMREMAESSDGDFYADEAWGAEEEGLAFAQIAQSGGTSADVTDVGALFRFDIPGRVTLPDQTSTMVTLVNTAIDGEDALIFQPGGAPASHSHPYRALLVDNSTPYPIQRAPIAIYRDGTFVGQGITPIVPPGESAVVSYALENRVDLSQRASSRSGEVRLTRIIDGRIHTEVEQIQATDFEARSSLDESSTLYLKVYRYNGYTLDDSSDFDEDDVQTEAGYYLVPVTLQPGAERTFTVAQSSTVNSSVDPFSSTAKQVFDAWLEGPAASERPEVAAQLEPIVEMLEELATLDQQATSLRQLRADVQARTNELRQNIQTLGDSDANAELRRTLVERLGDQDAQLEELAGQLVELSERGSVLRVMVTEGIRGITLR